MLTIRKREFIGFTGLMRKISVERVEFDMDSAADLPPVDYVIGHRLHQGSIAWDISTGDFYGMQSDGTWVLQTGEST